MPRDTRSCNNGLDDRCRDIDGEIRQKRGDTLVKTLRKTYGDDFASGVRSDARLDTLRNRLGGESLSKILKHKRGTDMIHVLAYDLATPDRRPDDYECCIRTT
jgi:hypothetical protein